MRILHVTTYLQGGAGRAISDLAIQQRQAGHDVIVVSDSGGQPGYTSYPAYLEALEGAAVELHAVQSTFRRAVPLNADAAGALSRLIGNRHVDVIHAHAAIPAMVARLACGSRPTPILVTVHGWGVTKTPEQARTDVTMLGLMDAVVTPSAALRQRLRRLGVRHAVMPIVPYGIAARSEKAINELDAALLASIRSRGGRIVVCVGTIGERKNQRLLVEALARDGGQPIHAVFVGDGSTAELEEYAAELDVDNRVHILGYRPDASHYLQHADAVVLPSRDEGLPVILLEALRDGVPIVASDIPEILEALDGGRLGHVFPAGSAEGLMSALGRTLIEPDDRRSALAAEQRRHWQQLHRLEQMVAAYNAIYAERSSVQDIHSDERVEIGSPS
jgi:glycosyltransferase involved in cell wall biosynthesis